MPHLASFLTSSVPLAFLNHDVSGHTQVDIELSLQAIFANTAQLTALEAGPRVILATNVAESSITIPGVTAVVDTCRRLHLEWSVEEQARLVRTSWASKSQCDQRKGRAGRCADGVVYRLLPRAVYEKHVPQWEPPELALSDLAEVSLLLATATHKSMRDRPTVAFQSHRAPCSPPLLSELEVLLWLSIFLASCCFWLGPLPFLRHFIFLFIRCCWCWS